MMERDSNTIRAIAWGEVFPWLSILRAFRIAVAAQVLVLAATGVLLTATAWSLLGGLFGTDSSATNWLAPYVTCPWKAATSAVPNQPPVLGIDGRERLCGDSCPLSGPAGIQERVAPADSMGCPMAGRPQNPMCHAWGTLTSPALRGLEARGEPIRGLVCVLLCGVAGVAIWAFFGAAICRIAAVQLAAEERVGLGAALRFAVQKWPAYFAAPLFPIGGVLIVAIPVFVLGWIMKLSFGLFLGGLLWPLALAAGLLMTLLLIGVLFGWPLMWATISVEGTDSFDALSRSYAYLFQRPLHYLFYAFIAGFIGWLGWLLVENFAAGVIWTSLWAAGWGTGAERIAAITGGSSELDALSYGGATLVRFWASCVKLVAIGYLFSYFWVASTAIYFLLRRDVDATETDEVYLDADASEESFGLPTIAADQAGAPVATENPVKDEPNEAE